MSSDHKSPFRIAVLGSSRGLGRAIVEAHSHREGVQILGFARKPGPEFSSVKWVQADFSKEEGQINCLNALSDFSPQRIIYAAGGGPFGPFSSRSWRDHLWSYNVTLLFPARLCHWALAQRSEARPSQVCLIGSSVAEARPDQNAASYASSKHGLIGLWSTLKEESDAIDWRLYSPGYMDTDLLPKGAVVRQQPVWDPRQVATDLLTWLDSGQRHDHRSLAIHPPRE